MEWWRLQLPFFLRRPVLLFRVQFVPAVYLVAVSQAGPFLESRGCPVGLRGVRSQLVLAGWPFQGDRVILPAGREIQLSNDCLDAGLRRLRYYLVVSLSVVH